MTVETRLLVCAKEGFSRCRRSTAMRFERGVVQDNHRIRVQRQPLQRQHAVVGLHHHVAGRSLVLVWEHAARQRWREGGAIQMPHRSSQH